MQVEVAYAEAHRQRVISITLPAGSSVGEALARAVDQWRLELPDDVSVGVFGELVNRERLLAEGDRVEIYRPLEMDPKTARRQRAQDQSNDCARRKDSGL